MYSAYYRQTSKYIGRIWIIFRLFQLSVFYWFFISFIYCIGCSSLKKSSKLGKLISELSNICSLERIGHWLDLLANLHGVFWYFRSRLKLMMYKHTWVNRIYDILEVKWNLILKALPIRTFEPMTHIHVQNRLQKSNH